MRLVTIDDDLLEKYYSDPQIMWKSNRPAFSTDIDFLVGLLEGLQ